MGRRAVFAVAAALLIPGSLSAQCAAEGTGGRCFLSTAKNAVPVGAVESPSFAPVPQNDSNAGQDDNRGRMTQGVIAVGGAFAGAAILNGVGHEAAELATGVGKVRDIPIYGSAITNLPHFGVIGAAAGTVRVPTTLGQMPLLGPAVARVPIVGPIIAGPPNPIIVGAVAIDSFVLPKFSPCGYTESSMFTMTDFNSPPRLRNYVNYLAPLPYTHPPIYTPAEIGANILPNTPQPSVVGGAVSIEN